MGSAQVANRQGEALPRERGRNGGQREPGIRFDWRCEERAGHREGRWVERWREEGWREVQVAEEQARQSTSLRAPGQGQGLRK